VRRLGQVRNRFQQPPGACACACEMSGGEEDMRHGSAPPFIPSAEGRP